MSIALIVVRNPSIYAYEVADNLSEGRKSLRLSGAKCQPWAKFSMG